MYLVGGYVRDEILGVKSKDIDYSVVMEPSDFSYISHIGNRENPFPVMVWHLEKMGFKIFLKTPEHYTVRAQSPYNKKTADFVLAREEGPYTDGRRPDWVKPGTLLMDQQRRDFTMNAIAKDEEGNYIDPFNGRQDIEDGVIRAVGDPFDRLYEDALRAVRAVRFAVTTGFHIAPDLEAALDDREICNQVQWKISDERIQAELSKMFRYNTISSLYELSKRNRLTTAMFSGKVSLDATMKTKGRGNA